MAKVSFTTGEGEPQSYRLQTHRPVRIGRDPHNDIVLRDAKVSRAHAEIVFERGFFVLHDLASANGTYVNGTKVRVAPLTDGAQIKLGNSFGHFTEELPDSPAPPPSSTIAADYRSARQATPPPAAAPVQPAEEKKPASEDDIGTAEQPKVTILDQPRRETVDAPLARTIPQPEAALPIAAPPIVEREPEAIEDLLIDSWSSGGDRLSVRHLDGTPLLYFRRPPVIVNLAANILAGIVFITGASVSLFLSTEKIALPAVLAAGLTILFTVLILALAPKRTLSAYFDEAMSKRALVVRQSSSLPLPSFRFVVDDPNGKALARFSRNRMLPLTRRKWRLRTGDGAALGVAREQRWSAVLLRLLTANFVSAFRPQYEVWQDGAAIGSLTRAGNAMRLSLHPTAQMIDMRVMTALAILITVIDR